VLSAHENYTGKIILRPTNMQIAPAGYNLKIPKPIPKSQAVLYIETILAMNNIAVIPMGTDALKIVQLPAARVEAPELILGSTLELPPSSKVASKLFQLDFLRVQEFTQMLGTMVNPNISQTVPLANANAILITDTISNLQRIESLLQQVDRPISNGMATKFYALQHAKASDLVGKLRGILVGTIQTQLGLGTSYSADDRTNQIILITDPRQFSFFDDLIEKLDIKSDPNTRNEVIFLKHAKAADVVQVLVRIVQGQTAVTQRSQSARPTAPGQVPGQPNAPTPNAPQVISGSGSSNPNLDQGGTNEFSSLVTVVNDDRSNSIVVSGTLDDIRLMRNLIDQLDNVLPQVRIEVVIAEVTLDDNHQSGISQLGLQISGDKLVGFALSGGTKGFPFSVTGDGSNAYASITRPGGNATVSGPWDLAGIISIGTTPRKTNATVLSVPSITTSHAKEAKFVSSVKQPIVTATVQTPVGATTSSSGFSNSQSVSQQDIGITLTVTPLIGGDGSIQMDIDADVQDIINTIPVNGIDQPIISHRETKSTITAHSGDIIVIGGMQRNKDTLSTNRFGPIPILGDILGARQKGKNRTELIFFLRAFALSNTEADNLAATKRFEALPARDVPERDAIIKEIDPKYQPPKKSVLDKILPK
jgi:general secretion pathway protein D